MKKMFIVLCLSPVVFLAGCNESQRKEELTNKSKMELLERMEKVSSLQERFIKQSEIYKEMGLVKIIMNPSGGQLSIDGGLYGGSLNHEITLPVGIHEFIVNWNAPYSPVRKTVYVCPALDLSNIPEFKYNESNDRVNLSFDRPRNLNVTTVNFRGIKK